VSDPRTSAAKWALGIVGLGVASTLAVLFFVLQPASEVARPPAQQPTTAEHRESPAEIAPAKPEPERSQIETPADEPAPANGEPSQARTWARVFVVGSVAWRAQASEPLTLLVRPGANDRKNRSFGAARSSWGKPEADGSFRIDVTSAFPEGADAIPDKLTLQALRDGHLPTEVEVDVPFDLAKVAVGGTLEIPVEIRLRSECKVTGTAWALDDPAAEVELAAFAIVGGEPAPNPSAMGTSKGAGQPFELSLDCDLDYAVLAFRPGYRPVTRFVRGGAAPPLELALERGATIAGSAALGGRGLEGTVQARLAAAGEPSDVPTVHGTAFAWTSGAFDWHSVSSRTGADGEFELVGLAPAEYDVFLSGVTGVYSTEAARVRVAAPASGVALVPEVCELRVTLVAGGSPAAQASVSLLEELSDGRSIAGTTRTDAEGRLVLWLRPGSRLKLTAGKEHVLTCGATGTSQDVRLVE
jgi:hypothetical protein